MTLQDLLEEQKNETIFDADASRELLSQGFIQRTLWKIEDLI